MDSDTPIPDVTPVFGNNASLADGIDGIMGRSKTDRMKLRPAAALALISSSSSRAHY
jgi:hypothetical protein